MLVPYFANPPKGISFRETDELDGMRSNLFPPAHWPSSGKGHRLRGEHPILPPLLPNALAA